MDLGTLSVGLAVKDLEASRAFHEKLGFVAFAGDASQNWLMLKNGDHVIGLFQGMFERNILLTFNPGWDSNAQAVASFTDVREIQRRLRASGIQLLQEADENTTGPASASSARGRATTGTFRRPPLRGIVGLSTTEFVMARQAAA
ncbi:MAG: VOC family protein [Gemmatimonadaceae bacterium]